MAGQGSGDSSRAREMAAHLREQGHELWHVSYDRGFRNLQDDFRVFETDGLCIASEDNRVSVVKTFTENLGRLPKGHRKLQELNERLFGEFGPDCVITDFEPMTAYLANHHGLPLITLDNQHRMRYLRYECPPALTEWFSLGIKNTLKKEMPTFLVTLIIGIITVVVCYLWIQGNQVTNSFTYESGSISRLISSGVGIPLGDFNLSFANIWGHNLVAIIVMMLLGVFTFGVLGVMLYMLNMGIRGAVVGLLGAMGLSPVKVGVFGILPHGVFEISALILTATAILHVGIVLVTPNSKVTLGEIVIDSLTDLIKIGVGIVFPLLTIAAAMETWVTPVLLTFMIK